jgi:hypothetical protein
VKQRNSFFPNEGETVKQRNSDFGMRARPVPKILVLVVPKIGTSSTKLTYFLTLLKKIFLPKNNLVFHFKAAFLMTRSLKTALKLETFRLSSVDIAKKPYF